ncbi:Drug/Metabolite Transporter (DMT) Superfamily [Phytophthora infestans T30-4]|uniref:Drug/Metabolite Transporter (DMT) Superfamily n=1 Tax=Phytophthora infestans (strain T30-4) TaxID=403677 RepID=D0NMP5_PHYIT|nr:Drug/Metabolite Transporter (DMT) Superfamily [Phytophthora infestans T30-4]EEY61802.1 Drug/Metabolite Transporter (DMT) Superfamily [Phytophthora infestans T30-4]|eukprot:XP_002899442.1 Drug/Metabolite Transporter (DMT) Superfamily [Phytophthora infestans T30-4]
MGEFHDKEAALSLRTMESKVAVCIAAWYVISLVTLWTNRYVVAKLRVDSNLLSLAQLGMSVVGGLGSELYLVGWTVCKRGMRKVLDDGLKDMVLLAGVRILTVLLGLTALKYIAVSFTQTIKSSAPFFTVVLTYFLLGQRTGWRVNFSLIPIVLGLIFCSLSDSSFHVIGFIAALMSNCVDCIQNVLTKRLLNRSYSTTQLQLYTSIIAVAMQLTFIAYNWMATPPEPALEVKRTDRSTAFVFVVLVLDGMCFFVQSALAYMLMSLVSPVTHSVANCVKRALIIVLSIYRYGEDVTPLNWCGMVLVIFGVYVFNAASRLEREQAIKGPIIAPAKSTFVETSTISNLSEIRVEKGR